MKILKKLQKLLIAIMVIILLELTVFNFRYYTTKMSRINPETIEISKENLTEKKYDGYVFEKTYTIKLNTTEVRGIKLNISQDSDYKEIKITPKFKDESQKYTFKKLESFNFIPKYKNREYIVLNSQENCIELELEMESNGDYNLESIEINTWYFEFNWFRVCMIIIISTILLYYKEINNYFKKHTNKKKTFYVGFILISTLLFIYFALGFGKAYENSSWRNNMDLKDMYRELTKSIKQGKITLDLPEEYREELLTLQNYQDYSEREKETHYLFDSAFYKGNFYCYYGIIPVITVLLPIALLTGIYCYSNVICIVYGTLVMIILLKIYLKLLEKFKVNFSFILEFLGYVTLLLTMELFVLKFQPNFYQAVDLCGIFWGLFAFWQIISLENSSKIKQKLVLIGLSYGCMVLTRPVYVFYIVPIVIAIWKYLIQNKKIEWKNVIVVTLPIVIMAIFQMWYNYIRFENILEFGQIYQITVNDTSTLKLEPGIAIDGVLSFLFNPPNITRHLPFLNYNSAGVNNGNVIFTDGVFGVFWHPFLLILLTARMRIKNNSNLKKLKVYTFLFLIITIMLLVIDTCLAGVIQRYLSDVLPALTILALVYWLLFIKESKNEEVREDRIKIYKIVCVVSIIVMSLFMYNCMSGFILNDGKYKHIDKRVIDYTIRHGLEFYK